jgi:3-deoxy-D-manno-octulosonate 8-phosphate phosphatase (KDO 8-P phosphatase)
MIDYDLTRIKAIMFDVDGVLSRETINMDSEGVPMRTVNIKDGYAIQLAMKLGLQIAIITGGNAEAIRLRYAGLGVKEICLGSSVKIDVMKKLMARMNLKAEEILFMGDDIPDYEVLRYCGCSCCPADAAPEIKEICRYVSQRRGGEGCARDVIEQVLRAQNKWNLDKTAFGW